jgi:ATP-dependent exoDNAse (exonuclease V) alpha subunit
MQRIAEGAMVGTDQYGKGIAQIKSAQDKLDEARDRMEELRQNKSSMDNREVRGEEKGIRDLATHAQEMSLAGAEKAYGIKREDARAAITSDVAVRQAELDRQNKLQIAGMPGDQQKMLTALGGTGGLKAGMELMTSIQAGKVTPLQSYEKYIQAYAGKDTTLAPPMTPQQYSTMLNQFTAAQNLGKIPGAVDTATPGRT